MLRKIKFREAISDKRYGDYWEFMHYGMFHSWGIVNGNSAAIIELEYVKKMSSRNLDAEELPETDNSMKGKVRFVQLSEAAIWFLD